MVATTRSRDGVPPHSAQKDEVSDEQKILKRAVKSMAGKKDKVYRKPAPKAELQQMRFPARAKTVKAKKTAKRLSLPNPPSTRKARKNLEEDEDRKQKTLTQMRWVPSTHPSDDEGLDDVDSDEEPLFDAFAMDDDGDAFAEPKKTSSMKKGKRKPASGAAAKSDETRSAAKKKPASVKKPSEFKGNTNRGRKRRKTTGDLDSELELEDEEEGDEISSSRYHTQTLTQMPSWKGLADMVQDSDEDIGFGLEDDLPQLAEQRATPQSKKRKRASPSALPAGSSGEPTRSATLAPEPDLPEHDLHPPPESTNPSVIPETPHHPRAARMEIPSSQPSPFTPNLELRYQSPINHGINRRSPLKARSTNVDAAPPTPSLLRKRTRSEIPDSWSTVNGGMPSSGGTGVKRTPLKEIHFADYSLELGEDIDQRSQRMDDDVVKDSDDEFEGFLDDEVEAPGTPSPHKQTSNQAGDNQPVEEMSDVEAVIPQSALPDDTGPGPSSTALQERKTQDRFVEVVVSYDEDEVVASTPAKQVIVPEDVTSHGLQTETPSHEGYAEIEEIRPEEQAATPTPKPSTRNSASQQRGSQPAAHRSPVPGSASAEVLSTPLSSVPKSAIQQPFSHASTQPDSSPEAIAGAVPTQVLSARNTATQEPSSYPTLQWDPEPSAEVVTTPIPSFRSSTQQPASNPTIPRNSTLDVPVEEDDKDDTELETPSRSRLPSSSSAVEKETPCSSPHKNSPAMSQFIYTQIGHTQFGHKSQAFESQRVPFEIIRQMAPQTSRSDAIVSFGWQEAKRIVEGDKTYVFRDFRIPSHVSRIWFYITEPVCQLKYMAIISDFKLPGDADSQHRESDVAEFALGNRTKYAWELLQVYQLNNPVPLDRMKEEGWVEKNPLATTFTYVPPAPLGALMGNLRCALFDESDEEIESQSQGLTTISQELAGQLMSDIEHSTQMQRTELASSSPRHRLDRHNPHEQEDGDMVVIPSSQDMADKRIRATPQRAKFASTKQVVFAKPNAPPARSQQDMADKIDDSPPVMRQHSNPYPSQQHIIKSTVRPSQATTMSAPPSQSQQRSIGYCTIPDSPSPPPVSQRPSASSLPTMAVDNSPIQFRATGDLATQSSLGLTALLGSSQGFGLAGIGGEQDSLMDDSRIRMPPPLDEVGRWDSDEE